MTADTSRLEAIARRVMRERGLLPEFSAAALAQLRGIPGPAPAAQPDTRDLRHLLWCSIDNPESRDLDQLTVAEPLAGRTVRVLVAIADVDALVSRDTPIDRHASTNTTSVYTVPRIFPMLPERLSGELTSLVQSEDRLAMVVDMTLAPEEGLTDTSIYPARVRNHAKLDYDLVGAWLAGDGGLPGRVSVVPGLDEQLKCQYRIAQALRALRHAAGALALDTIETRPVFEGARLRDLRPDGKGRAHELIEDLMIAANGATARFFAQRRIPVFRRILRTPAKWDRIVELARGFGETLPSTPSSVELGRFLTVRRRADPAAFPELSLCVIKLLGRGEYVVDQDGTTTGHFGLAVSAYTHSTAPNRRFPDLLTQRLLKAALAKTRPPYSPAELQALAVHCTQQEDRAAKVERQVGKSAAAFLLEPRRGETFDAMVTGAAEKGTWVRITGPTVEGRLLRAPATLGVGDRLRVRLVRTDIERGFIDFESV